MRFNAHFELAGMHAELSASKYHWIRYTDDKMRTVIQTKLLAQQGTALHELAATLIKFKQRLARNEKTLNSYVNDAIGHRMTPEVVLFYSMNSFGTADAIGFRDNKLRIHDLKTGVNKASFDQLMIYVALFCLEYEMKPHQIEIELRIYQNDEILQLIPDPDDIVHIMNKIVHFDNMITEIREEELG